MIDTTDDSLDTENRVAAIIQVGDEILLGHAPNKKDGPNSWDIAGKGHIEVGGNPEETVIREVKEETNIDIASDDLWRLGTSKYQKGKMIFFLIRLKEKPKNIKCISMFEMYGKKFPELSKFEWVKIDEAANYLYKGLSKIFVEYIDLIKELKTEE